MIIYKQGNLLDAETEALVNTVNTVGVMGKGIALQFKDTFRENYRLYQKAVKNGDVRIGQMFVTQIETLTGIRYIINFPTKTHWRLPSKYEYITEGLKNLRRVIQSLNIRSVALPPLGCGNGGLDWEKVKTEIERNLGGLETEVFVYTPNQFIEEVLQSENKKEIKLTSPRVMLLYLLYQYTALGESVSEFAAEKLTYFLQRFGETQLKLDFKNAYYGPYSGKVRHVLYALNGKYILGYNQKQSKPFEKINLNTQEADSIKSYLKDNFNPGEKERLQTVVKFIQGFETPYALELLSSIDSIIKESHSFEFSEIRKKIDSWSSRKKKLFPDHHVQIAINHLKKYEEILYS